MFYEAKTKYYQSGDDGAVKSMTECYLVEADTFSEAESRTLEHIAALTDITHDMRVESLKRSDVGYIIHEGSLSDDRFYRCKVNVLMVDDVTYRECEVSAYYIVLARDAGEVCELLRAYLDKKDAVYDIVDAIETNIVDIIFDKSPKKADNFPYDLR